MPSSDPRSAASSLPPGIALYQLAIGHYVSRALALVTRLGVADLLDTPLPAEELAQATGTHAPSLRRVLRLLASVGVLEEDDQGRLALTPLGTLLREDAPGSMKAHVTLFAGVGIQDSWKELEYCVRSGQPAFRKQHPEADPFTEMAKDPEAAANFDRPWPPLLPRRPPPSRRPTTSRGSGRSWTWGAGRAPC